MKKFLPAMTTLLISIALALAGCKVFESPTLITTETPVVEPISEDEYLVYAVVIPEIIWSKDIPALIEYDTCSPSRLEKQRSYLKENLPNLQEETLADFVIQDEKAGRLQESQFDFNHVFVDTKNYLVSKEIGKEEHLLFSWELFRRDHKEGSLICLSRVGFNQDHTQAFLYATSGMDSLAGQGYYLLLSYEKEIWKIERLLFAWMS
jgi:hypothetical protein